MMTLEIAEAVVGGFSKPSKMPCFSFSIPASTCKAGAKLREVKGSVCSQCYAFRGNYRFDSVKKAHARRFANLSHELWIEAMAHLINNLEYSGHFRWHDSGDLQSVEHLARIIAVCNLTPQVKHWLPTREYAIVSKFVADGGKIPANLIVRLSAYMVDGNPPTALARQLGVQTSGVLRDGFTCPASSQGNKCLQCRACWDTGRENINYKKH